MGKFTDIGKRMDIKMMYFQLRGLDYYLWLDTAEDGIGVDIKIAYEGKKELYEKSKKKAFDLLCQIKQNKKDVIAFMFELETGFYASEQNKYNELLR